jgi:hypothetical protein
MDNVTPIKPATSEAIEAAIRDQQERVSEALAVARLLAEHITAPPSGALEGTDEGTAIRASDALVRMLNDLNQRMESCQPGLIRRGEALLAEESAHG